MPARPIRSSSITCCKGVNNGAKLYTVDPRRTSSAEWSDGWLGLDVGSRHRPGQRDRPGDPGRRPREPGVHRAGHDRDRGVPGQGRVLHARLRRARDRRPGSDDPRARPRLRHGAPGDDLLDARDHRASQRRRQRARPDLAASCCAATSAATAAASTRCAARTTSRAAATWAPCPTGCRASSTSRTTSCGPSSTRSGASRSRPGAAGTCRACSTRWSAAI